MNSAVADKIRGVIYGQAIGDALGLGARFGLSQMPQKLADGLAGKQMLDDRIERLIPLLA